MRRPLANKLQREQYAGLDGGADIMRMVDEYLRFAKEYRELAIKAKGPVRVQFERISEEWERLAQYRLEVVQMDLDKRP